MRSRHNCIRCDCARMQNRRLTRESLRLPTRSMWLPDEAVPPAQRREDALVRDLGPDCEPILGLRSRWSGDSGRDTDHRWSSAVSAHGQLHRYARDDLQRRPRRRASKREVVIARTTDPERGARGAAVEIARSTKIETDLDQFAGVANGQRFVRWSEVGERRVLRCERHQRSPHGGVDDGQDGATPARGAGRRRTGPATAAARCGAREVEVDARAAA